MDSSFLIALFNKDDEFHQKAEETVRKLEKGETRFFVSNIVLAETINFIFRHQGLQQAKKFLEAFKKSGIKEIFLAKEIFEIGYQYLFTQKTRRGLNLFDCLHLATMKSLGIKNILTFDKELQKAIGRLRG